MNRSTKDWRLQQRLQQRLIDYCRPTIDSKLLQQRLDDYYRPTITEHWGWAEYFIAAVSIIAAVLLLLTGCTYNITTGDVNVATDVRFWPCKNHEIEFTRSDGLKVCLGGDAQPAFPRDRPLGEGELQPFHQ